MTECKQFTFAFHSQARPIRASFDGRPITSDAGMLLLQQVEENTRIIRQFAGCFTDHRDPHLITFSVEQLLAQRIMGLCLGYEDLNDHDRLRTDPLMGLMLGMNPDQPLAGKSTLNRLELTSIGAGRHSRYKKIVADRSGIEDLLVHLCVQTHKQPPQQIVLDLDATDTTLHGHQPGRFFHGYYDSYCYLPLYICLGDHVLCAKLRPSNIDASRGSVEELDRIVAILRQAWPDTRIIIRGDSGFCRESLMSFCEDKGLYYLLGLAKNKRLLRRIGKELVHAKAMHEATGEPARVFAQFEYATLKTWSRKRRVVAKAEHLSRGANPRFVVTNLPDEPMVIQTIVPVDAASPLVTPPIDMPMRRCVYFAGHLGDSPPDPAICFGLQALYETLYCGRGEMENRIKETQLDLFAQRLSTTRFRANQLRLWLSVIAYQLNLALRHQGLAGTSLARAQAHTIRTRLLKIGAQIRVSVRKVWVSLSSSCPLEAIFEQVYRNLTSPAPG